MFQDLKEIKRLRKKLNLTQFQLAKLSGVSQSLIAKIEAGKIDPTYSKTKQIFETLTNLSKKSEQKAKDIMTKKIITTSVDTSMEKVIKLMKTNQISQIPIIENKVCLGIVSESVILEGLLEKKEKINEIMSDCPPIVNDDTSITVLSQLLKTYPLVLVTKRGNIVGLLTKSDLIDKLN